jgi:myosin heavy subunit
LEPTDPGDDLIYVAAEGGDLAISQMLKERFLQASTYTRLGQSMLVSMAPLRDQLASSPVLTASDDTNMKAFASAVKEGLDREPHLFELAAQVYQDMVRTKEDQSMVFL